MPTYAIAVVCAAIPSTAIVFLIFNRLKVLDFKTLFSTMLASLISAFAFPGIFNLISSIKGDNKEPLILVLVLLGTFAAYLATIFVLSLAISRLIPKIGLKAEKAAPLAADAASGENYIEQIFVNYLGDAEENSGEIANNEENAPIEENNLEISVDTNENIDKMGIENIMQGRDILTIEQCIDEAFRLKEAGDPEGSILHYLYALDKKPEKDLTFWIVLDICVMYKALGQREMALEILNSYYDIYSDIIDISIKEEIEKNINDIRA